MATPEQWKDLALRANRAGDAEGAARAMAGYYAATEAAPDLSRQPARTTGYGSTPGGAPTPPESRGGFRPIPEDNPGVSTKEFVGNAGNAALNAFPAAYRGVKQLVGGDVSEADIKADRALTDVPGGGLGDLVGTSVAGGPIAGGTIKLISMLPKAIKYLPGVAQAIKASRVPIAAGVESGIVNPTIGDESRGTNMAAAAGTGGALQIGGKVFRRALTGPVRPNADAKAFLEKYIVPTPAQGGEGFMGGLVGSVENILSKLPLGISAAVKRGQTRPMQEVMDEVGHRGSPIGAIDVRPGRGDYYIENKKQMSDAYDSVLLGKTFPMRNLFKSVAIEEGKAALKGVPDEEKMVKSFETTMRGLFPKGGGNISGDEWKALQSAVRENVRDYSGEIVEKHQNKEMANAFRKVDDNLKKLRNKVLAPAEIATLEKVDNKYLKKTIIDDALLNPSDTGGETSLRNFVKAVEKKTPDNEKLSLTGEFQDLTEPAKRILIPHPPADALATRTGYITSNALAGVALGASPFFGALAPALGILGGGHAAARVLTNRGVDRYLYGDFAAQKKAAEALRKLGKYGEPALAAGAGSKEVDNE